MKWIKKLLSLFIEKTTEGVYLAYGFSYFFQNGWNDNKNWKERTIYFCLPLPWNKYGKYHAYYTQGIIVEGERWLTIISGLRYMKIGKKRTFKFIFYTCWTQVGDTKIIDNTYNMFLKGTLPKE